MEAKDRAKLTSLRRTAYHEAGHFVVGWYVRRGYSAVSVKPGQGELGHVLRSRRFALGKGHEFREAKAVLAGQIAETLAFPGMARRDLRMGGGAIVGGSLGDEEEALSIVKTYASEDEEGTLALLSRQTHARVEVLWPAIGMLARALIRKRRIHRREAEAMIVASLPNRTELRNAVRRMERRIERAWSAIEKRSAAPMTVYHRTPRASSILREGFRDRKGALGLSGVWVSDVVLDINSGAKGTTVLATEVPRRVFARFEVREAGKPYREACVPARLLNRSGKPRVQDDEWKGFGEPSIRERIERLRANGAPHLAREADFLEEHIGFLREHGMLEPDETGRPSR